MSAILPIYREWDAFSDCVERDRIVMEFRLVYQGVLNSSGNKSASGKAHKIRRYFHRQLVNLWKTVPILRLVLAHEDEGIYDIRTTHGMISADIRTLTESYSRGTKRYLPIVCDENTLSCSLDILLLRRDLGTVLQSGDLDGRVKTLIDALRIPVIGEQAEEGDENPLYCLMSDDKLISEVKVTADHLFADPEQLIEHPKETPTGEYKISTNHVMAIINVKTRGGMNLWS